MAKLHSSLSIILLAFFLSGLVVAGSFEISGSSEAREVHVSYEIQQSLLKSPIDLHSVFIPTRNSIIASKPPLLHWITASLGVVKFQFDKIGVSPFLQRSVSLLFAIGILLLVACFPYLVRKHEEQKSELQELRWVSLCACSILALTTGFFRLAVDARVDMVFSFFVTSAIVFGLIPLLRDKSADQLIFEPFSLVFLSCGLAVLAKGPLGVLLPFLVLFICYALKHGIQDVLKMVCRPRLGWIFLLIGPLWYLYGALYGGDLFLERHLHENTDRFLGVGHKVRKEWFYYISSWLKTMTPWACIFPYFLFRQRSQSPPFSDISKSLLVWIGVGTLFFSLSMGKRSSYLLPLYPALALYLSYEFMEFVKHLSGKRRELFSTLWNIIPVITVLAILLLVSTLSLFLTGFNTQEIIFISSHKYILNNWCYHVLGGALSALFLLYSYRTKNSFLIYRALQIAAIISIAYCWYGFGQGLRGEYKGYSLFARSINELVSDSDKIYVVKEKRDELFDPILYSLKRRVFIIRDLEEADCDSYVMVRKVTEGRPLLDDMSEKAVSLEYQSVGDRLRGRMDRNILFLDLSQSKIC